MVATARRPEYSIYRNYMNLNGNAAYVDGHMVTKIDTHWQDRQVAGFHPHSRKSWFIFLNIMRIVPHGVVDKSTELSWYDLCLQG